MATNTGNPYVDALAAETPGADGLKKKGRRPDHRLLARRLDS